MTSDNREDFSGSNFEAADAAQTTTLQVLHGIEKILARGVNPDYCETELEGLLGDLLSQPRFDDQYGRNLLVELNRCVNAYLDEPTEENRTWLGTAIICTQLYLTAGHDVAKQFSVASGD
jgi:hypothetical protein